MPTILPKLDFANQYVDWLKHRVVANPRGDVVCVSTPFLDAFNDGIQIYAQPNGGEWILHDNGLTLENLLCQGVNLDAERRQALIQHACAGCGVRCSGKRLEISASMMNFPQRMHFLLSAIMRVNDLWMSAVPHAMTDFFQMVAEFFDQQDVIYTANISIPGRTVEHPMDFVLPLPKQKERLLKLVASPKPQTAKLLSFSWLDIGDSRPGAEKIVLINDVRSPDAFAEEEEDEERGVSDKALAILRAYSDRVYLWSERQKPEFRSLWSNKAA